MHIKLYGYLTNIGHIAPLREICDLADKYNALVFIDEAHSTGFFGKTGRGTPEYCGVEGRIDIINSTLGKALGGATGGAWYNNIFYFIHRILTNQLKLTVSQCKFINLWYVFT